MTTGIVLTGGASRRMGTDKAFVVVDGRPMTIAVADALWEGGCSPVECQGGDLARLADFGMAAHADSQPGAGPVAAIADALERAAGKVVVVACDLPAIGADTVRALAAAEGAAAYATAEGRAHLASMWTPETLPAMRGLLATGDASYQGALEAVAAVAVAVSPAAVRNVNTPDDVDG